MSCRLSRRKPRRGDHKRQLTLVARRGVAVRGHRNVKCGCRINQVQHRSAAGNYFATILGAQYGARAWASRVRLHRASGRSKTDGDASRAVPAS